jgi:O-antigen chain-terminating methyltransferase
VQFLRAIRHLPADIRSIHHHESRIQALGYDMQAFRQSTVAMQNKLKEDVSSIANYIESLDNHLQTLEGKLNSAKTHSSQNEVTSRGFAYNHTLDSFYVGFEDRFRGSEDDIRAKVRIYPPKFKATRIAFDKYPVVDLGCGRGELLDSLQEAGIHAIGTDINGEMVKRAQAKGLEVQQSEALTFLRQQRINSLGGIAALHLIEHLPFTDMVQLFEACYRALQPGALAIFETPNPENLVVGADTFYLDPSHLRPIPPQLTQFVLEKTGFTGITILPLHEVTDARLSYKSKLLTTIAERLDGPRDYAAIAKKPALTITKSKH